MGLLDARHFIYDGISLEKFGMGIAWFDTPETDWQTGLNVEIQRGDFNMVRSVPNQYGVKYQDTLSFEFGIIKKCYGGDISFDESRAINNWLRNDSVYKKLSFDDEVLEPIHYYAICTEITDVVYGGITGKKLKFVCNAPYGFLAERKHTISFNGDVTFQVRNLSDNGFYYPRMRITVPSSYTGNVLIENIDDNDTLSTVFKFADLDRKEIIADMSRLRITYADGTLIPAYKYGWTEPTDYNWFRLDRGVNNIHVVGNGTLEISCEFPRKVGMV